MKTSWTEIAKSEVMQMVENEVRFAIEFLSSAVIPLLENTKPSFTPKDMIDNLMEALKFEQKKLRMMIAEAQKSKFGKSLPGANK